MTLPSVLAQVDTIPEDSGGPYVIAAYVVFLVMVVVYLAIMAQRLQRIAKTADELEARLDAMQSAGGAPQTTTSSAPTEPVAITPKSAQAPTATAGDPAA